MLIELDSSLASVLTDLSGDEWSALDLLARSCGEGKHLLQVTRGLAERLSMRHDKLCPYSRSVYNHLYRQAATRSINTSGFLRVRVLVTRTLEISILGPSDSLTIAIPLNWFCMLDRVKESSLLCENLVDCDVYLALARKLRKNVGANGVRISLNRIGGGGATTATILLDLLKQRQLTLCIVDSDKDALLRSASMGRTAADVSCVYHAEPHHLAELIILQARELENLLPNQIIRRLMYSGRGISSDAIQHLSDSSQCPLRLYADLKSKGITMKDILGWSAHLDKRVVDTIASSPHINPSCISINQCASQEACRCLVLEPVGNRALDQAQDLINQTPEAELWNGIASSHMEELKRVLCAVISWGAASRPVSS